MIKKLLKPLGLSLAALLLLNSVLFLDLTGGMATIADAATPVNNTGSGANLIENGDFELGGGTGGTSVQGFSVGTATTARVVPNTSAIGGTGEYVLYLPPRTSSVGTGDYWHYRAVTSVGVEAGKRYQWTFDAKLDNINQTTITNNGAVAFVDIARTAIVNNYDWKVDVMSDSARLMTAANKNIAGESGTRTGIWTSQLNGLMLPTSTTSTTGYITESNGWKTYSVVFTATETGTYYPYIFNFGTGNADLYTDNWRLEEIPPGVMINGDFELGGGTGGTSVQGFSVGTDTTARVVPNTSAIGGTGEYVLYLPPRTSSVGTGDYWHYRAVTSVGVEAGKRYQWTFDAKLDNINQTTITNNGAVAFVDIARTAIVNNWDWKVNVMSETARLMTAANKNIAGESGTRTGIWTSQLNGLMLPTSTTSTTGYITESNGWKTYSVVFTATETGTYYPYIFNFGTGNADLYTDNWRLEEIPPGVMINGDFEAGFMKGFIAGPKTGSTPTYGTARLVDAASVGGNGNYSLYLPDQTYLYQFVDGLTIGKTYVFSFNIRHKDYSTAESWATFAAVHKGSQNLTLGANPNGTPFSDVTRSASDGIYYTTHASYGGIVWTPKTLGSTSWYTVRQEFVADDTTAKLYIFNYNSDPGQLAQCYIDDIALVEKTDDFIMDGGFESGTLDGVVDTNAYLVPADSVGGNGNYVLYLPTVDNDNPSEAWQMITGLTPGRNYTLSYRMKWGATGDYAWYAFADIYSTRRQRLKNPNYGGAIAGKETLVPTGGLIFILDSRYNGTIVHRITSTAWQTVTIRFTATTTSVYLSFFHYINTIQDLYIDDISMTEDPEIIDDAIVKNGSFETGNLYKWTNSGAGSAASVVRDPVDASNNCLKIAATGASYADLYVQQKIEGLTPDQLYIMTFRMRLDEIQSEYDWGAFLGVSVRQLDFSTTLKGNVEPPYILYRGLNLSGRIIGSDATGLLMINKFSDTQWREYSIIFTPGQDHAYVYFSNYYKKCDLYVDDIVITEYEEIAEEKLVDVDFEDELELVTGYNSSDLWSKSSDKAHSGQYSAKYQGRYAEEWIRLEATDRYGSLIGKVKLEPNTTYRFSYWMLATGTYNHPPVARFAVWGTGFETTEYQYSFCSAYNQWEYKTIIFTTDAVTTDMSFHMAGCYMQRDITIYIDDICLEKIGSMIIEENITGLYCEDYFNQIPSGNFEGNLSSTVWNQASNSFRQVTNNQLGVAAGGYSYLQIDGNVDFTHPITINGGKKYNFAFSYLAEKNTDLQIGLVNSDGTLIPPMENSGISIGSLMTAGNTNGKWQRVGYTFLSPADGAVKLVIRGTGVKINLDEIQLFLTKLAWDENPNEYDEFDKDDQHDEFDKDDQHDESDKEESKGSSSTDTESPSTGERTIALWALILLAVTTGVVTRHLSQKSISRKGRGKS